MSVLKNYSIFEELDKDQNKINIHTALLLFLIIGFIFAAWVMADTSSVFKVNVTHTYDGKTEKFYFADHNGSLTEGNWIKLTGGESIEIPSMTLRYQGVNTTSYSINGTVTFNSSFTDKQLEFPMDTYPVYYEGDEVNVTFYGSTGLSGKVVSLRLLNTTPTDLWNTVSDAVDGNFDALIDLIDSPDWSTTKTLNGTGDTTASFNAPAPGDYVLVVVNKTVGVDTYELEIYSTTFVEILDYNITATWPSVVKRGDDINIDVELDAPESTTGYRYGAAMVHEDAYEVTLKLMSNGTVGGTNLTANDAILVNGTSSPREFNLLGVGLDGITANYLTEWVAEAFGSTNVSVGVSDVKTSNSSSLLLTTDDTMPAGKYILYILVFETETGRRLVAMEQGSVILRPPTQLLVHGGDDGIYRNALKDGAWEGWNKLPGATNNGTGVVVVDDRVHVLVNGTDGELYHGWTFTTNNSFSGWTFVGGKTPSPPRLASNSSHVFLVVRGNDDRIYYKIYSSSWGPWFLIPGKTDAAPGVAVYMNRLHFAVKGVDDDRIYHGWIDLDTITFSGWTAIGEAVDRTPTGPILASGPDSLSLVVKGEDDGIYYNEYSSAWSGWHKVPGTTPLSPGATRHGTDLDIVVKGTIGGIYHNTVDLTDHSHSGWTKVSGTTPSSPTISAEP